MNAEPIPIGPGSMNRAAELVRKGGIIVYPTDTVYGLGCDPFDGAAVKRLFEVKGRGSKPVPVLCSSPDKAGELVLLSPRARSLASANWPGALTIVAPLRRPVPTVLTQGSGTLGVRVPSDSACLELIGLCGGWLTGTSANISGHPAARTAGEATRELGRVVDLILDGGAREGKSSTVVEVVGDAVTLLRKGPVRVETK